MATVLIVDDEPELLASLTLTLEGAGFEVRSALTAADALRVLEGVDLVLSDLSMPGLGGLELLGEIRKRRPHLPVAIMTAHASVDLALQAMQAGAYDYILKPFQAEEILLKVSLGLRLDRYEHELRAQNDALLRTQRALEALNARLEEANRELERLATTDPLTGLANRRKLLEHLERELVKSRRYQGDVSMLMLDIDHFKRVNDAHGHPTGDRVLAEVAALIAGRARQSDLPARVGGEEFAVLLPSTSPEGALELAEDIRARVAAHAIAEVGTITVSIGVATERPSTMEPRSSAAGSRLVAAADRALYRAKALGRNRVVAG